MEILTNAVDSYNKNGAEKHNKIKLDCLTMVDKKLDAIYKNIDKCDDRTRIIVMDIIAFSLIDLVDEPRLTLFGITIKSILTLISLCEKMLAQ